MNTPKVRPSKVKPLTDSEVKNAKPQNRMYRLSDGEGLAIKVLKSGFKSWEYRFVNPETKKSDAMIIGSYPEMTLSRARIIHKELRSKVANGINPKNEDVDILFKSVFEDWWKRWSETRSTKYANQVYNAITKNCMDVLGNMKIEDIGPRHIAQSLQPFEDRGVLEYLHRTRSALNQMFSFALARGLCDFNPAMMVTRDAFKEHKPQHHRSLPVNEVYKIVEFFDSPTVMPTTRQCVEFIFRNLVRLQEACEATWEEIDFESEMWTIPQNRMKMREEHYIPLSSQSIELLKEIKKDSVSEFIFAGSGVNGHINKETPRIAINRAGVNTTIHGFRHLASTILNESMLFSPDIIEASLAHKGNDQIRATYNKAQYLNSRREMLQWWSDFIDQCDTLENNLKTLEKFNVHNV